MNRELVDVEVMNEKRTWSGVLVSNIFMVGIIYFFCKIWN